MQATASFACLDGTNYSYATKYGYQRNPRNVRMTVLFAILTILYYKNASFRSYSTFVHFFVRISSYKYAYLRRWVCSCRRV